MNTELKQIDTFDKYLRGQLSEPERAELEHLIAEDKTIKQQFLAYQEAVKTLKIIGFKQSVGQAIEKRNRSITKWLWPLSAAASLLILTAYFILSSTQSSTTLELYNSYFEPYPNISSTRKYQTDDSQQAFMFYNNNDYKSALDEFEKNESPSDTVLFYSAMSYLAIHQGAQALNKLEKIDKTSIFWPQTRFYKGMAYLIEGQIDSAQTVLKRIEPGDFSYKESQVILEKSNDMLK